MTNKERFIAICEANIKREGIQELLAWLETSDFYTAPASTKFHGNFEGGLVEHSLNVYDNLIKVMKITGFEKMFNIETVAVVGLFHDLCKTNYYKKGFRNVKDEFSGAWVKKETYEVSEKLPLGHGEKSCIILQNFLKLTAEELLAIRWHMGGWDSSSRGGEHGMGAAQDYTPLVTLTQTADMLATLMEEKRD